MLRRGDRAASFVLDEPLGSGGYGEVWKAYHQRRGYPAAVKVLHNDLACQPEAVARFEIEVDAMSATEHPAVARLYDTGYVADRPFFAMEFIDGRPLSASGRQSPAEARRIVGEIGGALAAAHDHGVIHRDVKPDNILLSRDGARVVLLDFGVAKLVDAGAALTARNAAIGTGAYSAPEQLRGEPVDPRTDVYALGLVLFELLTGAHPFADATSFTLPYMHLHGKRPRVSDRRPELAAYDDACARAMARDAGDRPPSMAAFVALLPAR